MSLFMVQGVVADIMNLATMPHAMLVAILDDPHGGDNCCSCLAYLTCARVVLVQMPLRVL